MHPPEKSNDATVKTSKNSMTHSDPITLSRNSPRQEFTMFLNTPEGMNSKLPKDRPGSGVRFR